MNLTAATTGWFDVSSATLPTYTSNSSGVVFYPPVQAFDPQRAPDPVPERELGPLDWLRSRVDVVVKAGTLASA